MKMTGKFRKCSTCKEEKEFDKFYKSIRKDGLEPYCKACRNSWNKKAYEKNKGVWNRRVREARLLRVYGLTEELLYGILKDQDFKCLICNHQISLSEAKTKASAVIDHDHITGKMRGILCHHCNMALGLFKDNADVLRKAAAYLERNNDCDE